MQYLTTQQRSTGQDSQDAVRRDVKLDACLQCCCDSLPGGRHQAHAVPDSRFYRLQQVRRTHLNLSTTTELSFRKRLPSRARGCTSHSMSNALQSTVPFVGPTPSDHLRRGDAGARSLATAISGLKKIQDMSLSLEMCDLGPGLGGSASWCLNPKGQDQCTGAGRTGLGGRVGLPPSFSECASSLLLTERIRPECGDDARTDVWKPCFWAGRTMYN